MLSLQGAILRSSACQVRVMLASWDLKVSPHWSPRAAEIRAPRSALLLWLSKGPGLPGVLLLPFSFSEALLLGSQGYLQDTQGWSPEWGTCAQSHI